MRVVSPKNYVFTTKSNLTPNIIMAEGKTAQNSELEYSIDQTYKR